MLEQVCFEHHAHDESCYIDREAAQRKHLAWCKMQCERGWPRPGWLGGEESAPRQHARITMDPSWFYCPLCGRKIQ